MVASTLFALLLASAPALLVSADVTPDVPGPGAVYKQGQNCEIHWQGDAVSTTAWKNMAIELMTGDNFQMVHLTTVAQDQDGTVDGKFEYPCPEVTPNSAIYFYQFSAPNAPDLTWTTRFTIAGADGSTTPPSESTQPGTNAPIPWGTGALKDPSKATPPPSFVASGSGSASQSAPVSTGPLASPSASASSASGSSSGSSGSNTPSDTSSSGPVVTTSKSSTGQAGNVTPSQSGSSSSNNTTSAAGNDNAALGSVRLDGAVAVLVGSALTFAFLL